MHDFDFASPAVAAFSLELENSRRDFVCHSALPAQQVLVSFIGPFLHKRVRWEMTLVTLEYFRQQSASPSSCPCPFIEIFAGRNGVHALQVGLELPAIDEPAIRKTLIMIRNYKRLTIGRHEFCPNFSGR